MGWRGFAFRRVRRINKKINKKRGSVVGGALEGLKVLDVSRFVAGPFCAMMLGDLGAEVVKVEKPGTGEDIRRVPPRVGGDSLFVMAFNRNKRSLTLDLRHPRGQEVLRALAARADILVENFRPGVMEAMGCGWDVLSALNERLIMARISGYGQDGPYADRPTFDAIAQAASGMMEMTGAADGPPTMAGTTVIDHTTGLHATVGVLAALEARRRTGRGQMVDAALFDSALSMLMTAIPAQAMLGQGTPRSGNRDRYGAPSNAFPTADGGYVQIMAGGDPRFARFAKATGLDGLLDDPRFADSDLRLANVEALEAVVIEWTRAHGGEEIEALMAEAQVPCSKVRTVAELFDHPQVRHRGRILDVVHPVAGKVPMQSAVARLSDTVADLDHAVPTVGQHNAEVLGDWLGYDADRVAALVAEGVL